MNHNMGDYKMTRKRITYLSCGIILIVIIFLLLSGQIFDGGMKPTLASVTKGNYSCIIDQSAAEAVKLAIDGGKASWTTSDVNDDGEDELILVDTTQQLVERPQPILGIFYLSQGKVECAVLDFNDSTEYFFLDPDGGIVYFYNTSGAVLSSQYYRCVFSDEFDCIYTGGLAVMNFLDGTDLNSEPLDNKQWAEEHPELAEMPLKGVHYLRFSSINGTDRLFEEEIDKQSFLSAYKALTGQVFPNNY